MFKNIVTILTLIILVGCAKSESLPNNTALPIKNSDLDTTQSNKSTETENIKILEKQCNNGSLEKCEKLGYLLQTNHKKPLEAIPFLEKACHTTSVDNLTDDVIKATGLACVDLGLIYEYGEKVIIDKAKSKKYYKKACDTNIASGCLYASRLMIKDDSQQSTDFLKKSCELDSAKGCYFLAMQYFIGFDDTQNINKAKDLYEKSCTLGHEKACLTYTQISKTQ